MAPLYPKAPEKYYGHKPTSPAETGGPPGFHPHQAVTRWPRPPAGWSQRRLSGKPGLLSPLGVNKAHPNPWCQWRPHGKPGLLCPSDGDEAALLSGMVSGEA